jgi:NAD(P)-dependent dehydrogenase (short-subunit alcohol dehydrogenase family)
MRAVCLVTGISAGIGKATAVALAQRGVHVVGVVRNAERGHAAVEEVRARVPAAEIDLLVADLSALDEVRRLAEEVRFRYDHLDVLLHNAGVASYGQRETTADGYERTFAQTTWRPIC